jgi:hypothetical protein
VNDTTYSVAIATTYTSTIDNTTTTTAAANLGVIGKNGVEANQNQQVSQSTDAMRWPQRIHDAVRSLPRKQKIRQPSCTVIKCISYRDVQSL